MNMTFLENLGLTSFASANVYYSVMSTSLRETGHGHDFSVTSPINGMEVARFRNATPAQLEKVIENAQEAFKQLRTTPAPLRG